VSFLRGFSARKGTEKAGKESKVEIRTLKEAQLTVADYNPRRDLQPEDAEYQKLRRSIEEFGYVEPIIWNERTGRVVGGHQRLKVLLEQGREDIEAVVVDLAEKDEKILNVLLNKVKGRWDIGKLADLLQQLDETGDMEVTGFENWELQSLLMQYDHIKDLMEEDFSDYSDSKEKDTFTMTFSLPEGARETVDKYIENTENAKAELATAIINVVKGVS
jgi:ParB-like chromosome segregation protein Spo0J